MKKIFVFVLGLMAVISINVAAGTPAWFTGTINWIYPLADGEIVVTFKEDSPSCTHTNTPKYHYLSVGSNSMTQEGQKAIYSLLLTAANTKKKVRVNFDAASQYCYINRAFVVFD